MWISLDVISDVQSQSCIKTKLARRERQCEERYIRLFIRPGTNRCRHAGCTVLNYLFTYFAHH